MEAKDYKLSPEKISDLKKNEREKEIVALEKAKAELKSILINDSIILKFKEKARTLLTTIEKRIEDLKKNKKKSW